jgi:hypothetical protein
MFTCAERSEGGEGQGQLFIQSASAKTIGFLDISGEMASIRP